MFAAGGNAAYCYRFNTLPNGVSIDYGVTHFQEVAFVFDNTGGYGYDVSPDPFAGVPEGYFELAKLMSASWASFIHDLDPNSFRQGSGVWADTPLWPAYSVSDPLDIVWDANVTGLAWVEPDTFRKEGIDTIISYNHVFMR